MQKAYCSISTTQDLFSTSIRHSVEATDIGAPTILMFETSLTVLTV
jgi:hypothetical protein